MKPELRWLQSNRRCATSITELQLKSVFYIELFVFDALQSQRDVPLQRRRRHQRSDPERRLHVPSSSLEEGFPGGYVEADQRWPLRLCFLCLFFVLKHQPGLLFLDPSDTSLKTFGASLCCCVTHSVVVIVSKCVRRVFGCSRPVDYETDLNQPDSLAPRPDPQSALHLPPPPQSRRGRLELPLQNKCCKSLSCQPREG